jgi:hypothetical protein
MKHLKAQSGPFVERPYFKAGEIESTCEAELIKAGLCPAAPGPVRIERFIEKRFKVTPTYEDLGEGVLGLTRFDSRGVAEVVIAKALDSEGSTVAERRIRTTLAHEAGHALFHTYLFVLAPREPLFGDASEPNKPKVLCREGADGANPGRYRGQWWEYQANCAIGGLLLPTRLTIMALEPYFVASGSLGLLAFDQSRLDQATRTLAELFDVNPVVARIRINQIYPQQSGQMAL